MSPTNDFAHRMRGAAYPPAQPTRVNQPRAGVTRKDFTGPLGLPDDASEAQILNALDGRLAERDARAAAARGASADDALYASLFGSSPANNQSAPTVVSLSDEELYARVVGA